MDGGLELEEITGICQ